MRFRLPPGRCHWPPDRESLITPAKRVGKESDADEQESLGPVIRILEVWGHQSKNREIGC